PPRQPQRGQSLRRPRYAPQEPSRPFRSSAPTARPTRSTTRLPSRHQTGGPARPPISTSISCCHRRNARVSASPSRSWRTTMRLLMTPAHVTLTDRKPSLVSWSPPRPRQRPERPSHREQPVDHRHAPAPDPAPSRPRPAPRQQRPRRVVHVIDRWRYDGRWWEPHELHRDYYLLELEAGVRLELFREGDD